MNTDEPSSVSVQYQTSTQRGTCAHDGGEHPALPVLDSMAVVLIPALKDADAAGPVGGPYSIIEAAVPLSHQHTSVVVGVDLQSSARGQFKPLLTSAAPQELTARPTMALTTRLT